MFFQLTGGISFYIDVSPILGLIHGMNSRLSQYVKNLREVRNLTQSQVARRARVDDSVVCLFEGGTKIRFNTLRRICRLGLKVDNDTWQEIKLLWLEHQSNEPVNTSSAIRVRARLIRSENQSDGRYLQRLQIQIRRNLPTIKRLQLQGEVLDVVSNPKLLGAVRQFHEVFRAVQPLSRRRRAPSFPQTPAHH